MLYSRSVRVVKDLATRGGKQALFLSIFPLQTEANGSDLLSRPQGLADMEALARSLPSSQVVWSCEWQALMAKAGAAVFSLNHILHFSLFHMAALNTKWWKCPCQSAKGENVRGISGPSRFFFSHTQTHVVDLLLILLCQSRHMHSRQKKKKKKN